MANLMDPKDDIHSDSSSSSGSGEIREDEIAHHDVSGTNSEGSASCCNRVNDSVYELYKPLTEPTADILFFHGLHLDHDPKAYVSTWTSPDGSVWPKSWLPEKFPRARVLTISYDASMKRTSTTGRVALYPVAETILLNLTLAEVGQNRPLILVGHSFGGLVIKQLCFLAFIERNMMNTRREDKKVNFLDSVKVIFFYGTPHMGSPFAKLVEKFHILKGKLVRYSKIFNEEHSRLHHQFQKLLDMNPQWHIAGVGESWKTDLGSGIFEYIVPEASARLGSNFVMIGADHISLCRPGGRTHTSYLMLVDCIRRVHDQLQVADITAGTPPADRQPVPKYSVGLSSSIKRVESLLESTSILGIWGMGGIGKTTLVKAVFNEISSQFEFTLFADEVKNMSGDVDELEEKLLWKVNHHGRERQRIGWNELSGKKALVVLDDVEKQRDTQILTKWRTRGTVDCVFILTSRDQQFLNSLDGMRIHEVKVLDSQSSMDLFTNLAFPGEQTAPPSLITCVEKIVQKCGGLPLTLEVLGKYLKMKKNPDVWQETSDALTKAEGVAGLEEVWPKLKLSYDSLEESAQQMFIDAATFFCQERKSVYARDLHPHGSWRLIDCKAVWSVVHGNAALLWEVLVDRSLVTEVADDLPIQVHEHLRTLAGKIGNPMALSIATTTSEEILAQFEHQHHFLCCLPFDTPNKTCYGDPVRRISLAAVCQRRSLRYLEMLWDFNLVGSIFRKAILPSGLVILRTHYDCKNFSFLSSSSLVILEVGFLSWQRLPDAFFNLNLLQSLRILRADNLVSLSDSFGQLSALRDLHFKGARLTCLPGSFVQLRNLQYLTFQCRQLTCLPESFGQMRNLQYLHLYCPSLRKLPDSFGGLEALRDFYFQYGECKSLPTSFGRLNNLRYLKLVQVSEEYFIERFLDSFGDLSALEEFILLGCSSETLPETFGSLAQLRRLELRNCFRLRELPSTIGQLAMLNTLGIFRAPCLQTLPPSMEDLKLLETLEIFKVGTDLDGTSPLILPAGIGHLPNLKSLWMHETPLRSIPNLQCLSCLRELKLTKLLTLVNITEFPSSALRELHLNSLGVEAIPTLKSCSSLEFLTVKHMSRLTHLPSLVGLTSLKSLQIDSVPNLTHLPALVQLPSLTSLELCYLSCSDLNNIYRLPSLTFLKLSSLCNLTNLPECSLLFPKLAKLEMSELTSLTEVPSLHGLTSLKSLTLVNFPKLESLPDLPLLSLEDLYLGNLPRVAGLPDCLLPSEDAIRTAPISVTFQNGTPTNSKLDSQISLLSLLV